MGVPRRFADVTLGGKAVIQTPQQSDTARASGPKWFHSPVAFHEGIRLWLPRNQPLHAGRFDPFPVRALSDRGIRCDSSHGRLLS